MAKIPAGGQQKASFRHIRSSVAVPVEYRFDEGGGELRSLAGDILGDASGSIESLEGILQLQDGNDLQIALRHWKIGSQASDWQRFVRL